MAKKNEKNLQMDWIDPEDKMTPDQWLTCHLLFYTHLLSTQHSPFKGPERKDLTEYTKKVASLLKKVASGTSAPQLSKSLQQAKESLFDLYINVNNENSKESEYVKEFHLGILRKIVRYIREHLADVTFTEYFSDLFSDPDGVFSPMAADILMSFISDVDDEDPDFDEPERRDAREVAYQLYKNYWKDSRPNLFKLPIEKGLVCHVFILQLCHKCLKRDWYLEYQHSVVSAITIYKGTFDCSLRKSSLTAVNEKFVSLMEKVLNGIKKGIDNEAEYVVKNEIFALSSDYCIEMSKTIEISLATKVLKDISVKFDDITVPDRVKNLSENMYFQAVKECTEIYAGDDDDDEDWEDDDDWDDDDDEDWDDDDDEDNSEKIEELVESYKSSWNKVRDLLRQMSMERIMLSHLIILSLCYKCLNNKQFAKYKKALEKTIKAYSGNSNDKQKEVALKGANDSLANLKERAFQWVFDQFEDPDKMSPKNDIFTLSVDNCLLLVNKIDDETLNNLLNDMLADAGTVHVTPALASYVDQIYERSCKECTKMYNDLLGDDADDDDEEEDWDDEEEDWDDEDDFYDEEDWDDDEDDEWDDDDDEDISEKIEELVESYKSSWNTVRVLLGQMPMECVMLSHVINLSLCFKILDEKQFTKYRKAVEDAVIAYGCNSNEKKKLAIKGANNALAYLKGRTFKWVIDNLVEPDKDSPKNDIFTISVDNCILLVNKIDAGTATDLLKDMLRDGETIHVTTELADYVEDIFVRSCKEFLQKYSDILGQDRFNYEEEDLDQEDDEDLDQEDDEDWDDVEEEDLVDDDEEYDHEDEYEDLDGRSELAAHISSISSKLYGFGEEGLLFHAISLEIMRRKLPENIYEVYRKLVYGLLSSYLKGAKRKVLDEKQLEADSEYIKTIFVVGSMIENGPSEEVEGETFDYMLVSIATENCLYGLSDDHKLDVKKALGELRFNKETNVYQSAIIDDLATKYINMASKELDGMVGD